MAANLLALCVGRALPPVRFLVFISVICWVDLSDRVRLWKIRRIRKYNDLIWNRTRYLPDRYMDSSHSHRSYLLLAHTSRNITSPDWQSSVSPLVLVQCLPLALHINAYFCKSGSVSARSVAQGTRRRNEARQRDAVGWNHIESLSQSCSASLILLSHAGVKVRDVGNRRKSATLSPPFKPTNNSVCPLPPPRHYLLKTFLPRLKQQKVGIDTKQCIKHLANLVQVG
jgi:hypothetical protein